MSQVSLVKCEDYSPTMVFNAVKDAIDLLGGIGSFVRPENHVLLKPNLVAPYPPEKAVTTHPSVVEAVSRLVISAGGQCCVGDSPSYGGETPGRYVRLLEKTGMWGVIERTGISHVRLNDSATEVEVEGGSVLQHAHISEHVIGADVLINLPKFKSHVLMNLTGAVKNLFGCVPGGRKKEYHFQAKDDPDTLARILLDILKAVRPGLSVVDAVVGMDGRPPLAGRSRKIGLILASTDPIAIDSVLCRLAGIDMMQVPVLRVASQEGWEANGIEVLGEDPDDMTITDFRLPHTGLSDLMPRFLRTAIKKQMKCNPIILRDGCTLCGQCADLCPKRAISRNGNRMKIDYSECIRCYCCHEVCASSAVSLQSGLIHTLTCRLSRSSGSW